MDNRDNESDINEIKDSEIRILSPLTLNTEKSKDKRSNIVCSLKCLCCEETFDFPSLKDEYLAHLYLSHRLVIADVDDISDLVEYLKYWITALKDHGLEEFCTTLLLDQLPDGTPSKNEKYYLLSDILPQDYELRKRLHTQRLERVLAQHQYERSDKTFSRECLFCRDVIKGLRSEYLEHLFNKHFLQLGKPENLVFIDELIDTVQNKIESLVCLFCERLFKDRMTLKEHMRKKGHKRINPNIKLYDKFFLINYKTEKPQNVKNIKNRRSKSKNRPTRSRSKSANRTQRPKDNCHIESDRILNSEDSDSNWSDWDEEKQQLTCLFCSMKDTNFEILKEHIKSIHSVDFVKETASLNFYQRIKVVNFIRHHMHILRCVTCDERCNSLEELQKHMKEQNHYGIGEKKQWDQPEYFFPTYEDDGILYFLEDKINNAEDDSSVVIWEDIKGSVNEDAEALSLENFVL